MSSSLPTSSGLVANARRMRHLVKELNTLIDHPDFPAALKQEPMLEELLEKLVEEKCVQWNDILVVEKLHKIFGDSEHAVSVMLHSFLDKIIEKENVLEEICPALERIGFGQTQVDDLLEMMKQNAHEYVDEAILASRTIDTCPEQKEV